MKNIILLLICGLTFMTTSVYAAVTKQDMEIVARALSFVNNPYSGNIRVGIVYAPTIPQSLAEANTLQNILSGGLSVGNLTMEPVMVTINEAESANVSLFFLTRNMGNEASQIEAISKKRKILCVTTDIEQVRNGRCGLGVISHPRVNILVNTVAAASSGTTFANSFRMMINEI